MHGVPNNVEGFPVFSSTSWRAALTLGFLRSATPQPARFSVGEAL